MRAFTVIAALQLLLVLGIIGYGIVNDDQRKLYGGVVALVLELGVAGMVLRAHRGNPKA